MHFVRSSVYQAEITEGGVREREVDTRSREEVELQERLRRLPEFSRNPNFKSYAEQVLEGIPATTPEPPPPTEGKQNPNLPHSVTEEEFEFYEALRAQDRRKKLARQKEEDMMRDEFHKAREASLKAGSASSSHTHRSTESEGSLSSGGKPSPFSMLGLQKQRSKMSSPFGDECIFEVTTKVFQEKQRKRALESRPSVHLIIKKPKSAQSATTPSGEKAEDAKGGEGEEKAAAAVSSESSSKDSKVSSTTPADAKEEDKNVFASLCEAYGDSDSDGSG